jgi:dephospho-CoA kinase
VVVVDAPEELQVERMVHARAWTEEEARARIAAQATREQRNAVATHLVENTGTIEDLRQRVAEVFDDLSGR